MDSIENWSRETAIVGAPEGTSIVVLHIGEENTEIASRTDHEPQAKLILEIGAQRTASEHFKRAPPTPLELENAIITVEDEIARARTMVPKEARLYTRDAAIRAIARLAGVRESEEMTLTIEAVEQTFERMVQISQGMPAVHSGIPSDVEFAATLLILREFMHHLQFASITVKG